MRRDPPQPKPQAGGGSFLRGAYSGAWKALGAQTTLRRKPILSDEESGQGGVGEPDAFERLWTPHRIRYIKGENKPESADAVPD